ncbi:MAG: hypothetical protein CVV42_19795 [Candidatus Riflebacteria bacterium HGW-Riflebacteria-2]|jgi:hypothetical protein|nr:MAG: hypothetical protein CVV42_19795 [Candidatus Riflebacteria bacterium HGW-Riflebacteria-2]
MINVCHKLSSHGKSRNTPGFVLFVLLIVCAFSDISAQHVSAEPFLICERDVAGDDIIELPKPGETAYPSLDKLPDNLWLQDDDDEIPAAVSKGNKGGKPQISEENRKKLLGDPEFTCIHGILAYECPSCQQAFLIKQTQKSVPGYAPKPKKNSGQGKAVRQTKPATRVQQPRHPDDPLPIEEPDEQEVIETVVGGVAVLGGAGLGLYAMLSGLGLIGAKTGAGAVATAGVAATAATGASATGAVSGTSAGVGAAEAVIPKVGDVRSYIDETGSRQIEVFDGNYWADSGTHSASQAQIADNQTWQQRQFERNISGDNAFNREVQAKAQARAEEWQAKNAATRNEIRKISKFLQNMAETDRSLAEVELAGKELGLAYLETTKTVIDCVALPLVGATLGPAATLVSSGYSVVGEAVAGATEGFINADSITKGIVNAVKGGAKGAAQGAVSVVVGEGLNAAASVGSTAIRTLNSSTPLKVLHNDSSGAELIKKLWGNFKGGKGLTHGLVKTPPQIPPQRMLRITPTNAILVEKWAVQMSNLKNLVKAERIQDTAWGVASSYKSYFIDGSVGNDVNSALFAE